MIYQSSIAGNKALAICDFFGEYLANFFGITTPKYDYEIEYYKRMIEEVRINNQTLFLHYLRKP